MGMYKKGFGQIATILVIALIAVGGFLLLTGREAAIPLAAVPTAPSGNGPGADSEECRTCQFDGNTITLSGVDMFDSSLKVDAKNYKYKVNGGNAKTDSDGIFDLSCGDLLTTLWGDTNSSIYYRDPVDYAIGCGSSTPIDYADGVQNNSVSTIQCFNEEGNLIVTIDGTQDENETVAAGDSPSLRCEIQWKNKKGAPQGAIMVAELAKAAYDEEELSLTGLGSKTTVPSHHALTATGNAAFAWNVAPHTGAGVSTFFANIDIDDTTAPDSTQDVTLTLYDNNCYEEEDVKGGPFLCGQQDLDGTRQGLNNPSFIIQMDDN